MDSLPIELQIATLQFLNERTMVVCRQVCQQWKEFIADIITREKQTFVDCCANDSVLCIQKLTPSVDELYAGQKLLSSSGNISLLEYTLKWGLNVKQLLSIAVNADQITIVQFLLERCTVNSISVIKECLKATDNEDVHKLLQTRSDTLIDNKLLETTKDIMPMIANIQVDADSSPMDIMHKMLDMGIVGKIVSSVVAKPDDFQFFIENASIIMEKLDEKLL